MNQSNELITLRHRIVQLEEALVEERANRKQLAIFSTWLRKIIFLRRKEHPLTMLRRS